MHDFLSPIRQIDTLKMKVSPPGLSSVELASPIKFFMQSMVTEAQLDSERQCADAFGLHMRKLNEESEILG